MIIDSTYQEHQVFKQLSEYSGFYKSLSFSIFGFVTQGTNAICNIDSYVYSSIQGTLESIKDILIKGRINDSYALLRKYYDSTIINVYSNLYLDDNFSLENFVVEKIDNWIKGKEQLPEYRVMSQYIRKSKKLSQINELLYRDNTYKSIRDRCNDHTHYNFYQNMLINDNEIYLNNRLDALNTFSKDLENIFILHFSYLFYLNDHYMMSSDYVDSLECGITPEEGSQYYVAPFIQKIFDDVIKRNRMDLAEEIKKNTSMKLE
ncbi:MAG: hypothetical protein GTO45_06335 [Candidatus Aminicenantes bacterium]|nr:hypothetical protein [Candidatus Aminicenantes bacterium]NIM78442.1 hypothetical protein [Candidatus Aminicenantes bacterium]NIN17704.1 hypothetical protein [Candidatus Aminicenantes bacterium]NIN41580.1 hypothetical protein [Candidatus Aminicenantes bacterium]NIN84354.1 hypothetical protein [Candidatus Aminicenantes bacterium]